MTVVFRNIFTGSLAYHTLASNDFMSPEWIATTAPYTGGDWRLDVDLNERIETFLNECSDDDFYDACEDVYNNFSQEEEAPVYSALEFKFGFTE